METQKITAKSLVNGSRQVNLWREEIKLVTTTLLGLIQGLRLKEKHLISCGERINWVLGVNAGCLTSISLEVCLDDMMRTVYSTASTTSTIEGPLVTRVHQCLDRLVSGMIEIFPELGKRLKFLVDAAMAAE